MTANNGRAWTTLRPHGITAAGPDRGDEHGAVAGAETLCYFPLPPHGHDTETEGPGIVRAGAPRGSPRTSETVGVGSTHGGQRDHHGPARARQGQDSGNSGRQRAGQEQEQDTSRTRRCHEQDANNAEQTKDTEQTDQGRADTKQRNLYSENAHVVWRSRQLWDYPAFDS